MKVLFLDIDGVLNKTGTKDRVVIPRGSFHGIDRNLLQLFLFWLKLHPDVKIVLSSSWRTDQDCMNHLNQLGIHWIGVTAQDGAARGIQIQNWIDNQTFDEPVRIAILDDISYGMAPVGRFLVQTSDKFGLQDKHLRKLDKLLND